MRERTLAGLKAARARGRMGGRPALMTTDKTTTAQRMYDQQELTVEQIARALGVSRSRYPDVIAIWSGAGLTVAS